MKRPCRLLKAGCWLKPPAGISLHESSLGKTQKTIDIELPTTGERAFVQVKSVAEQSVFSDYLSLFQTSDSYDRMFFVWHRGTLSKDLHAEGVTMIGTTRLAELILDTGLARWLRNKVS